MKKIVFSLIAFIILSGCSKDDSINGNNDYNTTEQIYFIEKGYKDFNLISNNKDIMLLLGTDSDGYNSIQGGIFDINKNEWLNNESFVIKLDSLNRATSFLADNIMYNFYNYSDETCDIAYIDQDGSYKVLENVKLPDYNVRCFGISKTRADNNVIDDIIKTIAATKASLELANVLVTNPKSIQAAIAGLDYIGTTLSGFAGLAVSGMTNGLNKILLEKLPGLFAIQTTLIEAGRTLSDNLTERFIGNWKVEIVSADQISENSAQITYIISGIKDEPSFQLLGNLGYVNTSKTNIWTNVNIAPQNGMYTKIIPLKSHGLYKVVINLSGGLGFFTRNETKFETNENPVYIDRYGNSIPSKKYIAPNGKIYYIVDPSDWENIEYTWNEALSLQTDAWSLIKTNGMSDKCSDRNTSAVTFEKLLGYPKCVMFEDWGLHDHYVSLPNSFGDIFYSERGGECWSNTITEQAFEYDPSVGLPYRFTINKEIENNQIKYKGFLGNWNGQGSTCRVRLVYNSK